MSQFPPGPGNCYYNTLPAISHYNFKPDDSSLFKGSIQSNDECDPITLTVYLQSSDQASQTPQTYTRCDDVTIGTSEIVAFTCPLAHNQFDPQFTYEIGVATYTAGVLNYMPTSSTFSVDDQVSRYNCEGSITFPHYQNVINLDSTSGPLRLDVGFDAGLCASDSITMQVYLFVGNDGDLVGSCQPITIGGLVPGPDGTVVDLVRADCSAITNKATMSTGLYQFIIQDCSNANPNGAGACYSASEAQFAVIRDNAQPASASGYDERRRRRALLMGQMPLDRDCPYGQQLCEIPGRRGIWECLSSNKLDSCGGCPGTGSGRDCTDIPHMESVDCHQGRCHVMLCEDGYKVASNGTACVV